MLGDFLKDLVLLSIHKNVFSFPWIMNLLLTMPKIMNLLGFYGAYERKKLLNWMKET